MSVLRTSVFFISGGALAGFILALLVGFPVRHGLIGGAAVGFGALWLWLWIRSQLY